MKQGFYIAILIAALLTRLTFDILKFVDKRRPDVAFGEVQADSPSVDEAAIVVSPIADGRSGFSPFPGRPDFRRSL